MNIFFFFLLFKGTKQSGPWYDILNYLVLGSFNTGNTCLSSASNINNLEKNLGDTWFPKSGEINGGKTWVKWNTGSSGLLNFERTLTPNLGGAASKVSAYAMAYIYTEEDKVVKMGIGSDDGLIVWLNGKEVFRYSGCRGGGRAQNTFNIELVKGENAIMMKVSEKYGAWNGRMSLQNVDGTMTTNIRIEEEERIKWERSSNYHEEATFGFSDDDLNQMIVLNANYMDHELQSDYVLIVRATDNGIGSLSDTALVSVTVKDVNEPPTLEGSLSFTVEENKCGGGHPAKDTCTVSYVLGNVGALDLEDIKDPSKVVTYHFAEHDLFEMSVNGEFLIKVGQSLGKIHLFSSFILNSKFFLFLFEMDCIFIVYPFQI